jgi:hypothetical protein
MTLHCPARFLTCAVFCSLLFLPSISAQHSHPAPQKLGRVNFPISCSRAVQPSFNHALALLHSFAYSLAQQEFAAISQRDPQCAMAHWGIAISYYHQLWDPPILPSAIPLGAAEIEKAQALATHADPREQAFINALAVFYSAASRSPVRLASLAYTNALREAASQNPDNPESQIFYALSFLSIASPTDPAHTNQKLAAQMLQPLFERLPDHPGLAHYLIHAYDHPDLARQGLPAARAYSKIAPAAPHALHMPSHIYTLLGLWPDSIQSNLAARAAARQQHDTGEELHAMDYLMYADLQAGRFADAATLLTDLRAMSSLPVVDYKIAYASTIMPIRFAIERQQWDNALKISANPTMAPQFRALAEWANSFAASHLGNIPEAELHLRNLHSLLNEVLATGDDYWTQQLQIQVSEAQGWLEHARGNPQPAGSLLRAAADQEDHLAKRPITPGPVTPAREQLADLLLQLSSNRATPSNPATPSNSQTPSLNSSADALREYQLVLAHSPGRRNALNGAAEAAALSVKSPSPAKSPKNQ